MRAFTGGDNNGLDAHSRKVQAISLLSGDMATPVSGTALNSTPLIEKSAARVWRSLRYLGISDQELPDASQEVFLIVHRRLGEFRGDSSFETWLFGICVGVARNARRRQTKQRQRFSSLPDEENPSLEVGVEQTLDLQRARVRLRAALSQLSEEQREVFVLHEIEELEMRTVAETVGCPLFTAYSRLRRARQELTKILKGDVR